MSWYALRSESSLCLGKDGNILFDPKINAVIFKDLYSNIASDLVKQLPTTTSKYDMNYVRDHYNNIELLDGPFGFSHVHKSQIMKTLLKFDTNNAAGIDGLSGTFLKDDAKLLSKPFTVLINLLISLSAFQESCKVAKLKPPFKKGSKLELKTIRSISLLHLISKVLEKVIHDQTQNFLTDNSILYCY